MTPQALHRIDAVIPGYAEAMIKRLEQVNGRKKNVEDYEAIRQWLAEVLVVNHLAQPRTNQIKANYYSSKQPFTDGGTVRDWLTGQSFADQYSFGMDVLTQIRRGIIQ